MKLRHFSSASMQARVQKMTSMRHPKAAMQKSVFKETFKKNFSHFTRMFRVILVAKAS